MSVRRQAPTTPAVAPSDRLRAVLQAGPIGATRLQAVLRAGAARHAAQDVGVYARPPSTSTPETADALKKALQTDKNKAQIKKLLEKNKSDYGDEMVLLASAGASKRAVLLQRFRAYDPLAQWTSGYLYMAFTPAYTNVANVVNELNMWNIAHVWLMRDGLIKPVTEETMKEWRRKWNTSAGSGMDVPVHWVDDKGELLPKYHFV